MNSASLRPCFYIFPPVKSAVSFFALFFFEGLSGGGRAFFFTFLGFFYALLLFL